jgi:hypothetical protein
VCSSDLSIAFPIIIVGHMRAVSAQFYIGASTSPTYELQLFREYLNNGNAGENTLAYVAGCGRASAAGGASSINNANFGTAGTYLPPGLYWMVIRNTSATNTLIIGGSTASFSAVSFAQTKTLGSTIVGANLDFHAATWTKITNYAIAGRIGGEVFGETSVF